MKLHLPSITLVAVACTEVDKTILALKKSMRGILFANVLLITHEDRDLTDEKIEVIKIEKLDYSGYNHFIAYRLAAYIPTDFGLVIQHDGYVLRPNSWDQKFLEYDYIGAPWRSGVHFTPDRKSVRVGNGGFSLRSKKLLNILNDKNLVFSDRGSGFIHEDGIICVHYRRELEDAGILFAPVSIASKFSREKWCSDSNLFPFGFHNNRHYLGSYLKKKIGTFLHIKL